MIVMKTNLPTVPKNCKECMCKMRVKISSSETVGFLHPHSVASCIYGMDISQHIFDNTKHDECPFMEIDDNRLIKEECSKLEYKAKLFGKPVTLNAYEWFDAILDYVCYVVDGVFKYNLASRTLTYESVDGNGSSEKFREESFKEARELIDRAYNVTTNISKLNSYREEQ